MCKVTSQVTAKISLSEISRIVEQESVKLLCDIIEIGFSTSYWQNVVHVDVIMKNRRDGEKCELKIVEHPGNKNKNILL